MKIKDQIDKFEKHKEFSNVEFNWTAHQKEILFTLPRDVDVDLDSYENSKRAQDETLKRVKEIGLVLHIKN